MFDRKFFAENLKELIKERDKTQRKLADYLHHENTKTISKWVNGKTSPSVDDVVKIATYFDVSVDELLGCNQERRAEEKKKYLKIIEDLFQSGDYKRRVEVCEEALEKFPNELQFKYHLIWALMLHKDVSLKAGDFKKKIEKVIEVGNEILRTSLNDEHRIGTINCLCRAYSGIGDWQSAMNLVKKMPNYFSCQNELARVIPKDEFSQIKLCQRNILNLVEVIFNNIQEIFDRETLNKNDPDSMVYMLLFVIRCYQSLYPDGDYGRAHSSVGCLYASMFKIHLEIGKETEAVEFLEKAAEHAICYDNKKGEGTDYTSPMIKGLEKIYYDDIKMVSESECEKLLSLVERIYEKNKGEKPLKVLEIEKKLKSFST